MLCLKKISFIGLVVYILLNYSLLITDPCTTLPGSGLVFNEKRNINLKDHCRRLQRLLLS